MGVAPSRWPARRGWAGRHGGSSRHGPWVVAPSSPALCPHHSLLLPSRVSGAGCGQGSQPPPVDWCKVMPRVSSPTMDDHISGSHASTLSKALGAHCICPVHLIPPPLSTCAHPVHLPGPCPPPSSSLSLATSSLSQMSCPPGDFPSVLVCVLLLQDP